MNDAPNLRRRIVGLEPGDHIFTAPATGRRYAFWPQLQFDRARAGAGLDGGPHTLRHTFASSFLGSQPDIALLSRLLGHEDIKITMKHYAHLLPDHIERARNVVSIALPLPAAELERRVDAAATERAVQLGRAGGKASGRARRAMDGALPDTTNQHDNQETTS